MALDWMTFSLFFIMEYRMDNWISHLKRRESDDEVAVKVVILSDAVVGKSSIVNRYDQNTIGEKSCLS
jgi:hypothetical protein